MRDFISTHLDLDDSHPCIRAANSFLRAAQNELGRHHKKHPNDFTHTEFFIRRDAEGNYAAANRDPSTIDFAKAYLSCLKALLNVSTEHDVEIADEQKEALLEIKAIEQAYPQFKKEIADVMMQIEQSVESGEKKAIWAALDPVSKQKALVMVTEALGRLDLKQDVVEINLLAEIATKQIESALYSNRFESGIYLEGHGNFARGFGAFFDRSATILSAASLQKAFSDHLDEFKAKQAAPAFLFFLDMYS